MPNCQQVKHFKPGIQMPRIITMPLFSNFTQISIANAVAKKKKRKTTKQNNPHPPPKKKLKANVLHCKDLKDTPISALLTGTDFNNPGLPGLTSTRSLLRIHIERERKKKTDKIKYCLAYQFSSNTNRSSHCLPLK